MSVKLKFVFIAIILAGIIGYLYYDKYNREQISSIPTKTTSLQTLETIATGLEVPWALAFLPDGSILVTERKGTVRLMDKDNNITQVGKITVAQNGESGLHGVALHPDFSKNHFVYFYYTYASSEQKSSNKVVRFVLENGELTGSATIVDNIPGAIFHDGGRIKFGPDGYLYITTGDAQNPSLSQDRNSLAGKILRVTDTGKASPGNPFNNLVYSYGHRNPQGLAWDSSGRLWITEHGQSATDELNQIEKGKNYGWPEIRGDEQRAEMETPKIQSGSSTWAPAGMAFYNGSLFFGGLRSQTLFELDTNSLELKEHFKDEFGRIREVVLGPDNMLYITTSNRDGRGDPKEGDDKILRVDPTALTAIDSR